MRDHPDVGSLLATVACMPKEQLPAILVALAARMAGPDTETHTAAPGPLPVDGPSEKGEFLTAAEAAQIARVPTRTVYEWSRRSDWRVFTHRLSRKVLRIEGGGFRRWLDRQGKSRLTT